MESIQFILSARVNTLIYHLENKEGAWIGQDNMYFKQIVRLVVIMTGSDNVSKIIDTLVILDSLIFISYGNAGSLLETYNKDYK